MTPDADLRPFLEAILAEPDAEHLKAVLADWLEEHGDPRGFLLREGAAWLDRVQRLPIPERGSEHPSQDGLSERQRRLFAVACVRFTPLIAGRRVGFLVGDGRLRRAVVAAELLAHGLLPQDVWTALRRAVQGTYGPYHGRAYRASEAAALVLGDAVERVAQLAQQAAGDDAGSGRRTRPVAAARRWQVAVAELARDLET